MRIAIRSDGGPKRGYGHLVRTGALAQECLKHGDDVLYFTQTPNAVREELSSEITVVKLGQQDEIEEVIQHIQEYSIDVLFTDCFKVDTKYQQAISELDVTLAVRHNFKHYSVCCDILVYGDLHADKIEYEWIGSKPELCLGSDYILLREQFQKAAQKQKLWRNDPKQALIIIGGSDINNQTPEIMRAFENFDAVVDVVIGPGFTNEEEIRRTAQAVEANFNLLHTPKDMAKIMYKADFAISAVGGTIFELLATRTPFVGIPQAGNQQQRAAALQQRDLGLVVKNIESLSEYIELLSFSERRRELYDNMDDIVDGKGTERVYQCLQKLSNLSD